MLEPIPNGSNGGTWELAGRTVCPSDPDDENSPLVPCTATAFNGFTLSFDEPFYSLTLPEEPVGETIKNRPGATQKYYGVDVSVVKRLSDTLDVAGQLRLEQLHAAPAGGFHRGSQQPLGRNQLRMPSRRARASRPDFPPRTIVFINANWQFNVTALYQGPWGINLGANFFGRQGFPEPYYVRTRATDAAGVNHRYQTQIGQVDDFRYDNVYQLDLRLDQDVQDRPGRGHSDGRALQRRQRRTRSCSAVAQVGDLPGLDR